MNHFETYKQLIYKKFNHSLNLEEFNKIKNYSISNNIIPDKYLNINCINCKDCCLCINCKDCYNCINCKDCEKMKSSCNSINCDRCYDCNNCKDCVKCISCISCDNISGLANYIENEK